MFDFNLIRKIEHLEREGNSYCIATIVDARGSIPQITGARAIFSRNGLVHGTIGGGMIEATCKKQALDLIDCDKPVSTYFQRYNLQKDLGMTCGGELAIFFEVFRPELKWHVIVFGAGHVAQVLCRFLGELDCKVVCVDTRAEWLERLPQTDRLEVCKVNDFCDGIAKIAPGADVILMTMGHVTDLPILKAIERRKIPIARLGVIGSDSKSAIIRRQLADDGITREFIDRIICPLGDKLGNNTPGEIAVGIVSQLLRQRHAA